MLGLSSLRKESIVEATPESEALARLDALVGEWTVDFAFTYRRIS
jgi:hypothetical protein